MNQHSFHTNLWLDDNGDIVDVDVESWGYAYSHDVTGGHDVHLGDVDPPEATTSTDHALDLLPNVVDAINNTDGDVVRRVLDGLASATSVHHTPTSTTINHEKGDSR